MEMMETQFEERTMVRQEEQVRQTYERAFPRVAAFVSRMGGSFEDARDIFHDALVVYYEVIAQDSSRIRGPEEAYLLGIAKHLWARKHRRERMMIPMNESEREISVPEDINPTVEDKRLLRILESAGQKCMDLLRAFYYQRRPVKDLTGALGYTSEHAVSAQKYKCLEKIRNTIKQKSLRYDDFIE
ncbi:MAG: sigma-70 family RNA polymerase sigma factor [Prolixibacteraceae bacterium]